MTNDPLELFQGWFGEAERAGVEVPEAMTLATADADGRPLWDGKSAISLREATAAERAEWQRSRDDAIRDGFRFCLGVEDYCQRDGAGP